jgi:Xaa-Pro aminopeptidase
VFFTGRKTSEQERALAAVLEAKAKAERAVRAGASTHDLDRLARKILEEHGVEDAFGHSLGHGIGLEVHEGVTLSQKRPEERLLQSEIVTIEPGVYFPGKFGIRLEDEVVVGG